MSSSHLFALHLQVPLSQGLLVITDQDLVHRIRQVLRLEVGEEVEVFNRTQHALAHIALSSKKEVHVMVGAVQDNCLPAPVTFLLPLLKVGVLHDAVYALAETGVAHIQLVTTQKSQHSLQKAQFEKLSRVVIAAAEQCKMYQYPSIGQPIALSEALQLYNTAPQKLFFDVDGVPAKEWFSSLNSSALIALVGPEGDLTPEEKELVYAQGFTGCALTSTVLRAVQAVSLASGMINSAFK